MHIFMLLLLFETALGRICY